MSDEYERERKNDIPIFDDFRKPIFLERLACGRQMGMSESDRFQDKMTE